MPARRHRPLPAIKKINAGNFRPYGWVIEYPAKNSRGKNANLFHVVIREKGDFGWRIAYLVVRDKRVERLEQHRLSYESLEPVKGASLLYVSLKKDPEEIACFYLDRPVILKKCVWHGILTLNGSAEIKITENRRVRSAYWRLGFAFEKR